MTWTRFRHGQVSDVLPGNVHDLAAARQNVLGVLRPFLAQCRSWPIPALKVPGMAFTS
jgi:hypothetical protein